LGVLKFTKLGFVQLFSKPPIEVTFKAKLYPLLRAFQQYVAHHLHVSKLGQLSTFDGRESNWHFDSSPFFWP
jgi:hypothetical protein